MAELDGKEAEHHLKTLVHRERIKEHFRRIKVCEARSQSGGVDKVDKENIDGTLTTIFGKVEMEGEIIRANKQRLQQAEGTPLRMEPLQTIVGEQAEDHKWEGILNGAIQLPKENIEEGTQLWYDYMQSYEDNPRVDSKGALATTFDWRRPNPRWASHDLVGMIRYHKTRSPISWEGKHVKGHQDDTTDPKDLDEWVLGNIAVDKEAGQEMDRFRKWNQVP